jgi:mycothiol synthase
MEHTMLAEFEITTEYGLPEGYTLRGATLDDLPEAVEMFNAYSRQLIGTDEVTLEGYRREWEIPILNLPEDVKVVVAPDGSIAGCQEVWDLFDPHTRINTWGRVHPNHHGRGIATAMVRWAEERARRAIPRAPEGTRVAMMNWISSLDTTAHDVMLRSGFNLIRHSYRMRIDLTEAPPAPVWPDGITLRPFDPDRDLEAVAWADREAFRDHWGFVERPFEQELQMFRHWLGEPRFDPALWFVAVHGDEVAGISLCDSQTDDDPDMGWVASLGVLRAYRKQGLGLALLRHSFGELYRRGRRAVGLGVDAQNLTGALRLYEKAGMRVYRKNNTYEKELRPGVDLSTQSIA